MTNPIQQKFMEQLIIKAIPDIDNEALDFMVEEMEPTLYDRITSNVATQLTESQMENFATLIDNKASYDEVYTFLSDTIDDYEWFLAKTYDAFEEKYLEDFEYFKKEMKKKQE